MKKKYLLLIPLLLIILSPSFVNAETVTTTNVNWLWRATKISAGTSHYGQINNIKQTQLVKWPSSSQEEFNYTQVNLLTSYNTLGASSYAVKIRYYFSIPPHQGFGFNTNQVTCSVWSSDIYNNSCTVTSTGIDTDSTMQNITYPTNKTYYADVTFVFSTKGSNYIEFALNFKDFTTIPDFTFFGYKINSFEGQVNLDSVIVEQNGIIINKNDQVISGQKDTNKKLDDIKDQNIEAEKTRKNIFQQILDLPGKILNVIIDALKSLFIPKDGFFEDFINDFKDNFLGKLGFLAYPFELIADILGRYLNISTNPVINIPQINEPFTGGMLIAATSFNIKEIFETGEIGTFYNIYLSFVSVIIIFMFLNYSIKKFNEFVKDKGDGN